jgi:hypothetical protein
MNNSHLQALRVDNSFSYRRSLEPYWLTLVLPWWDETFCSLPDRPWGPSSLLHKEPFPGGKATGVWCRLPSPRLALRFKRVYNYNSNPLCSYMAGYRVQFTGCRLQGAVYRYLIIYRWDLKGRDLVCLEEALRCSPLSQDSTPCWWADISRIRVVLRATVW